MGRHRPDVPIPMLLERTVARQLTQQDVEHRRQEDAEQR